MIRNTTWVVIDGIYESIGKRSNVIMMNDKVKCVTYKLSLEEEEDHRGYKLKRKVIFKSRTPISGVDLDLVYQFIHSSLNTWVVGSESKLDTLLVKCDRATCSLVRIRTWSKPTILFWPSNQKCSFHNLCVTVIICIFGDICLNDLVTVVMV